MTKNALITLCGSIILGLVLIAPSAFADEAQQNSGTGAIATTRSSGIVSQVGSDSIAVQTTASQKPITFRSNETTTWVDESGEPVEPSAVKAGVPVIVYYSQSGSKLVAAKVIVKATTTTPAQPRG